MIKTARLIITFYQSFAAASWVITLSCLGIAYKWGIGAFVALFWFKVITLGLIFYYIRSFKKDNFIYYKNLGLSRKVLWVSSLSIDLIVFLTLIILTLNIR